MEFLTEAPVIELQVSIFPSSLHKVDFKYMKAEVLNKRIIIYIPKNVIFLITLKDDSTLNGHEVLFQIRTTREYLDSNLLEHIGTVVLRIKYAYVMDGICESSYEGSEEFDITLEASGHDPKLLNYDDILNKLKHGLRFRDILSLEMFLLDYQVHTEFREEKKKNVEESHDEIIYPTLLINDEILNKLTHGLRLECILTSETLLLKQKILKQFKEEDSGKRKLKANHRETNYRKLLKYDEMLNKLTDGRKFEDILSLKSLLLKSQVLTQFKEDSEQRKIVGNLHEIYRICAYIQIKQKFLTKVKYLMEHFDFNKCI